MIEEVKCEIFYVIFFGAGNKTGPFHVKYMNNARPARISADGERRDERPMKIFAKVLTVITLTAVLLAGYVVWAATAQVSAEGYRVEAAADRADSFEGVVGALRSGSESIVAYDANSVGAVEDYVFVTYTLRVRNADLVELEWIDLTLNSQPGDVLLVKPTVQDIPALNQSVLSYTLMVERAAVPNYERTAALSYYIYGHYKEIPITLR